jgi:hypothetical protein
MILKEREKTKLDYNEYLVKFDRNVLTFTDRTTVTEM